MSGKVHEWRGLKWQEETRVLPQGRSLNGVTVSANGFYTFHWNGISGSGGTAEEARASCDEFCVDMALGLLEGLSDTEGEADAKTAMALARAARAEAKRWERRVLELERRMRVMRDAADGRI